MQRWLMAVMVGCGVGLALVVGRNLVAHTNQVVLGVMLGGVGAVALNILYWWQRTRY